MIVTVRPDRANAPLDRFLDELVGPRPQPRAGLGRDAADELDVRNHSRLAVVRNDQLTSVLIPVISTVAPERVLSEKLILTSLKIRGRVIYKHTKRLVVLLPVLLADSLIAPVAKEANTDDCFGPLVPAALRSPHALARI